MLLYDESLMKNKKHKLQLHTPAGDLTTLLQNLQYSIQQGEADEVRVKTSLGIAAGKRLKETRDSSQRGDKLTFLDFYNMFAYDPGRPFGILLSIVYSFILTILYLAIGFGGLYPGVAETLIIFGSISVIVLFLVITPCVVRTIKYKRAYYQLPFRITGISNVLHSLCNDHDEYIMCRISVFTRDMVIPEDGYIHQSNTISKTIQAGILQLIAQEGNRYFCRAAWKGSGEWIEWARNRRSAACSSRPGNHITGYVNYKLTGRIIKLIIKQITPLQQKAGIIDEFNFIVYV
jgi:hypothetical protein